MTLLISAVTCRRICGSALLLFLLSPLLLSAQLRGLQPEVIVSLDLFRPYSSEDVRDGGLVLPALIGEYEIIYPREALARGLEQVASITAMIDTLGQPTHILAEGGEEGNRMFQEAIINGIQHARFRPTLRDGHPVASRVLFHVSFRLKRTSGKERTVSAAGEGNVLKMGGEEALTDSTPATLTEEYLDVIPEMIPPSYSETELQSHLDLSGLDPSIHGTVYIRVKIDWTGRILGADIVKSDDPALSGRALDALLKTAFHPATIGGTPHEAAAVVKVICRRSGEE